MQRGFGGKICPQTAKNHSLKTVKKSTISAQNKFFLKKSKKSVAKIVGFICATHIKINTLMKGNQQFEK